MYGQNNRYQPGMSQFSVYDQNYQQYPGAQGQRQRPPRRQRAGQNAPPPQNAQNGQNGQNFYGNGAYGTYGAPQGYTYFDQKDAEFEDVAVEQGNFQPFPQRPRPYPGNQQNSTRPRGNNGYNVPPPQAPMTPPANGEVQALRERVAKLEQTVADLRQDNARTAADLGNLRRTVDQLQSARPGWTASPNPEVEQHLSRLDDQLSGAGDRMGVLERRCQNLEYQLAHQ